MFCFKNKCGFFRRVFYIYFVLMRYLRTYFFILCIVLFILKKGYFLHVSIVLCVSVFINMEIQIFCGLWSVHTGSVRQQKAANKYHNDCVRKHDYKLDGVGQGVSFFSIKKSWVLVVFSYNLFTNWTNDSEKWIYNRYTSSKSL